MLLSVTTTSTSSIVHTLARVLCRSSWKPSAITYAALRRSRRWPVSRSPRGRLMLVTPAPGWMPLQPRKTVSTLSVFRNDPERIDERMLLRSQRAPRDDDRETRMGGFERHRDADAVRDHVQLAEVGLDPPTALRTPQPSSCRRRRGSTRRSRPVRQRHERCASSRRRVGWTTSNDCSPRAAVDRHRVAVDPLHQRPLCECIEVVAGGDGADAESVGELADTDEPALVEVLVRCWRISAGRFSSDVDGPHHFRYSFTNLRSCQLTKATHYERVNHYVFGAWCFTWPG